MGGIASGRVPVGNAAGETFSSWLNPTSILIGALAVVTSAYLAAVYLSADAVRLGEAELEHEFRLRALLAGVIAGALALAGLLVLGSDSGALYHHLIAGAGLAALIVSVVAGVTAVALVWWSRFELARYAASLAVAAIIAGSALAQQPTFLPGLTVEQAAAPHDTLVLVIVAVIGGLILFPSLALLFGLVLHGRFDPGAQSDLIPPGGAVMAASRSGLVARAAAACLVAGFGLLTVADPGWAHAIGVISLFGFIALGFVASRPDEIANDGAGGSPAGQDPAQPN